MGQDLLRPLLNVLLAQVVTAVVLGWVGTLFLSLIAQQVELLQEIPQTG